MKTIEDLYERLADLITENVYVSENQAWDVVQFLMSEDLLRSRTELELYFDED